MSKFISEIWKDVEGYEGIYMVSSEGRVKSLKRECRNREMILSASINSCGYRIVSLWNNKKEKRHYVHRLVGSAFIENTENLPCINHKDEIRSNNKIDNLEWCTHKYNTNYGTRNNKMKKGVIQLNKDGNFIKCWESRRTAADTVGTHPENIYACCCGKQNTAGGYRWQNV